MKKQICGYCKNEKASVYFGQKSENRGGGTYKICKECRDLMGKRKKAIREGGGNHTAAAINNNGLNAELEGKTINLDFLLSIKRVSPLTWTWQQASYIVMKIEEAYKAGDTNFLRVYKTHGFGKSVSGCSQVMAEMKKLAEYNRQTPSKSMTIQQYFEEGRRFKIGNSIYENKKKK